MDPIIQTLVPPMVAVIAVALPAVVLALVEGVANRARHEDAAPRA